MFEGKTMKKKNAVFVIATIVFLALITFINFEKQHTGDTSLTESEFSKYGDGELSVLAFTSPYCSACKNQEKIVDKLQSELTEGPVFEYVDVTKQRKIADHFEVAIVPTLVITRHGIEVGRFTGRQNEPEIKRVIEKELGKEYCSDGTLC
jgi:thiol-disulfide isomerase/thioredoxin